MTIAIPSAAPSDLARMKEALRGSLQYINEALDRPADGRLMRPEFQPTWMVHGHYHAAIRDIEAGNASLAFNHLDNAASYVLKECSTPVFKYFLPDEDAEAMLLLREELSLHQDRVIGVGYTSAEVHASTLEYDKASEGINLLRALAPSFHAELSICVIQCFWLSKTMAFTSGLQAASTFSVSLSFGRTLFIHQSTICNRSSTRQRTYGFS